MAAERRPVGVRGCWALAESGCRRPRGPFRDALQSGQDEGMLDLAVAEDRAMLRSNLSAATVQWHGDAAHMGRRSFTHTMLLVNAINLLDTPAAGVLGSRSSRKPDEPDFRLCVPDGTGVVVGPVTVLRTCMKTAVRRVAGASARAWRGHLGLAFPRPRRPRHSRTRCPRHVLSSQFPTVN